MTFLAYNKMKNKTKNNKNSNIIFQVSHPHFFCPKPVKRPFSTAIPPSILICKRIPFPFKFLKKFSSSCSFSLWYPSQRCNHKMYCRLYTLDHLMLTRLVHNIDSSKVGMCYYEAPGIFCTKLLLHIIEDLKILVKY